MISLDVETASLIPEHPEYALQPWRIPEGGMALTATAIGMSNGRSKVTTFEHCAYLEECYGERLVAFNAIFDIAVLISAGYTPEVLKSKWADAMLMWRWLDNSQLTERGGHSWNLVSAAKRFLKDWPLLDQFISLKAEEHTAGDDKQYWELRARLDAVATAQIAERIWSKLDDKRRRGVLIQSECLVPIANSWVRGIRLDKQAIIDMRPEITKEMAAIEASLGLLNPGVRDVDVISGAGLWMPSKVLRSPKQLAELVYTKWGLPIDDQFRSETTGAPGTNKAALTYLAENDDKILEIMRWRALSTQLSKFIESPLKAMEYLGSDIVHPSPRMFGTYTGRMTYSSKTMRKFHTGIALHQWPRSKALRNIILPPVGMMLAEFDAAGQEMRGIAEASDDETMLNIFLKDMDGHGYMGAQLGNIPYETFMTRKAAGDEEIVGPTGLRYFGKFANLSNQYRVGFKKLRIMARVQYGLTISLLRAKEIKLSYARTYPGVAQYWKNAPNVARHFGFAETFLGRKFKLTDWGGEREWATASSAINFPIQGFGADMKELAVAHLVAEHPDVEYGFDLHDALFVYVPEGTPLDKLRSIKLTFNNMDYTKHWNWTPRIKLLWDCEYGTSWGSMKALK